MFYKEWIDFVVFPLDSNKCLTREMRLDISNAVSVRDSNYSPELGTKKGVIFPKHNIFFDNDKFEKMFISDLGQVVIWTKKRVWGLYRLEAMERMQFLPRHPDSDELWGYSNGLNHIEA